MACDRRKEERIAAHLDGQLGPAEWAELRAHVSGCASCRQAYDRRAFALRLLAGGPKAALAPSPAEYDATLAVVLHAVAPAVPSRAGRWRAFFASPMRWVPAAAVGLGLVSLVPWLTRETPTTSPAAGLDDALVAPPRADEASTFQRRGRAAPPERASAVRAFCVRSNAVAPLRAEAGTPVPECSRSMRLRFTASNPGAFRHLFLVGVDETRALKWYAPRPPETASVAAPPSRDEVPVGRTVRIAVNHDVGLMRVYALFSDAPLGMNEVEGAVARLPKKPEALPEALPLQGFTGYQHSLLVRITP